MMSSEVPMAKEIRTARLVWNPSSIACVDSRTRTTAISSSCCRSGRAFSAALLDLLHPGRVAVAVDARSPARIAP